jgi:hypothetical protein
MFPLTQTGRCSGPAASLSPDQRCYHMRIVPRATSSHHRDPAGFWGYGAGPGTTRVYDSRDQDSRALFSFFRESRRGYSPEVTIYRPGGTNK